MDTKAKGYIFGIIASTSYGMNPLFALPLYKSGMDPDSVLFFRYLFAIPILALMMKIRGRSFRLQGTWEVISLSIMGILAALSSLTLFQSYNYIEAGIASTLLFIYPVIVVLIMSLCFKEKLSLQTILCMALALYGIWLLYNGDNGKKLNFTGILLVLISAVSYAVYIVGVNKSKLKDMSTLKLTFYVLLFGVTLFLVRIDFCRSITVPDELYLWGNLILLAILPTAISFLCTTQAVHYIGSTPTAVLGALEPLTAVFFGIIFFEETLTLRVVCGISIIILSVTLIIARNNITHYLVRLKKLFPKKKSVNS